MQTQEKFLKQKLDALYAEYNKKRYIKYDPIKYVYRFEDRAEKEVVGLISSSLSFGRVSQIFKAMDSFLGIVNDKPLTYLLGLKARPDRKLLSFKYRFVSGLDIHNLLLTTRSIIEEHGSLGEFARDHYERGNFLGLVQEIINKFESTNYLIPSSLTNSPCKRLFMYFRWMVRDDNIDLGLWNFLSPQELVIPLDTHIARVSSKLGLSSKRTASLRCAIEITDNLKKYSKDDPVKYDWALSHIGIIKNNFVIADVPYVPKILGGIVGCSELL